jgi:putative hydrolase of the HAD superfamily
MEKRFDDKVIAKSQITKSPINKMNKITDIFFDLDHTLWDFDKNSALAFEAVFAKNKIEVELPAFLETYVPINHKY